MNALENGHALPPQQRRILFRMKLHGYLSFLDPPAFGKSLTRFVQKQEPRGLLIARCQPRTHHHCAWRLVCGIVFRIVAELTDIRDHDISRIAMQTERFSTSHETRRLHRAVSGVKQLFDHVLGRTFQREIELDPRFFDDNRILGTHMGQPQRELDSRISIPTTAFENPLEYFAGSLFERKGSIVFHYELGGFSGSRKFCPALELGPILECDEQGK